MNTEAARRRHDERLLRRPSECSHSNRQPIPADRAFDGGLLDVNDIQALRQQRVEERARESKRFLAALRLEWAYLRLAHADLDLELHPIAPGRCRDCHAYLDLFRYGRVDICLNHLIARANARARLEAQ